MDYIELFKCLHSSGSCDREPIYKAVLLLTIIDMYENNFIEKNEIIYDEMLKNKFIASWEKLLPEEQMAIPSAYLPYWHLYNEDFWHIVPIRGKEDVLSVMRDERIKPSESKILDSVKYAEFDEDLYFLMTLPSSRSELKKTLLESYTKLSRDKIERFVNQVTCTIDYSIEAIKTYKELSRASSQHDCKVISAETRYNRLSDVLTENLKNAVDKQFNNYIQSYRFESSIILDICDSSNVLLDIISDPDQIRNKVQESFACTFVRFLKDLKISLLSEEKADILVEKIESSIEKLSQITMNGNESKFTDEELFDEDELLEEMEEEESKTGGNANSTADSRNNTSDDTDDDKRQRTIKVEKYHPVEYYVENTPKGGVIYDLSGKKLYSDDGLLKVIRGRLYRFNYKPMCLTVKGLEKTDNGWIKGGKLLVPYSSSKLYRRISVDTFIDEIEDFIERDSYVENKINLNGSWYNFDGDELKGYIPESVYQGMIESSDGEIDIKDFNSVTSLSPSRLEALSDVADSPYDYLFMLSILSLFESSEHSLNISLDELACMMIANAWEIFYKNESLCKKDIQIAECISLLIEESKEYMEQELNEESSRDEVFDAIKDYPIAGDLEDTVDDLINSAPYTILKIWSGDKSNYEIVKDSVNLNRSCLYEIHNKPFETSIVINNKWISILAEDNEMLQEYFKAKFIKSYDI